MQKLHHEGVLYPMSVTCICSCVMVTNMGQTPTVRGFLHLKQKRLCSEQNLCTNGYNYLHANIFEVDDCCQAK